MLRYTQQRTLPKAEHQMERSASAGQRMQDGVCLKRSWRLSEAVANTPLFFIFYATWEISDMF